MLPHQLNDRAVDEYSSRPHRCRGTPEDEVQIYETGSSSPDGPPPVGLMDIGDRDRSMDGSCGPIDQLEDEAIPFGLRDRTPVHEGFLYQATLHNDSQFLRMRWFR
jgi:hypothetical protein